MIVGRVEGGAWVDRVVLWIGTAIIDRRRLVYNLLPFSYRGVHSGEEGWDITADEDRGFSYARIEPIHCSTRNDLP